jgi:hypothetical protein
MSECRYYLWALMRGFIFVGEGGILCVSAECSIPREEVIGCRPEGMPILFLKTKEIYL